MSTLSWFVKVRRAQNVEDFERWEQGALVPTLNVADNTGDVRATVLAVTSQDVPPVTVRRLTPTECERLQGFPDGWTAHRIQQTGSKTGQVAAQADSPRYKQMGNAVTVPVVAWIADRLASQDAAMRAGVGEPAPLIAYQNRTHPG